MRKYEGKLVLSKEWSNEMTWLGVRERKTIKNCCGPIVYGYRILEKMRELIISLINLPPSSKFTGF